MITSKVSAALFRSRLPSSACLSKLMNFFVNNPVKFWHFVTLDTYESFKSYIMQTLLHTKKSFRPQHFQHYLGNCRNDNFQE